MFDFFVEGDPVPQGSKSAFVVNGRAVLVEGKGKGTKRHKDWRALVASEANITAMLTPGFQILDGPVEVTLSFYLAKPKSKPKWKVWCDVKPDIDKLCRSVFDSLTGTLVHDDSRVVSLTAVKQYPGEDGKTGVRIVISPIDEPRAPGGML